MSKEPVQRYIIKRVDGFVSVCDTQDNEAPIDNSAIGLEALLNGLNTAVRLARFERIHDLNQMGGLCEENARLKADLEKSDAVVFTQAVENERLKAEVERLTKAGDAMAEQLDLEYLISQPARLWRAAKGVQS
jgi:hypothetical protein